MSGFAEYDRYDALGLAELIRNREASPAELCEEAIRRTLLYNPQINAVIQPMFNLARQAAAGPLPEGPLRGVPFLLKDLLEAYAGVPLTGGSRLLRNNIPGRDSETVRRYKRAGLVILGKTNTPEFGLLGVTEPQCFGPCRNPWNPGHTPGGSSGGSGAAVAAGMVPMASGGDGGGSIRIPASCCGLFGLKPSRGRTPTGPDAGEVWQGAVSLHVLTRSVRDSAVMLDLLAEPEPGAPYGIPAPAGPYSAEVSRDPGRLAIAFSTASPIGRGVDPECVRAVEKAARLLADLGHSVEEARPPIDGETLAVSYVLMNCGEMAAEITELEARFGARAVREGVEPASYTLALLGRAISSGDFISAMRGWGRAARAMAGFFETYDLLLTPTLARPPVRIGELAPKPFEQFLMQMINAMKAGGLMKAAGVLNKVAFENLAAMPFTQLANITGLPAMSVPLHWTAQGLPVGVQFMAPYGDEARLLRLAGQLEQAAPWFERRPPGYGGASQDAADAARQATPPSAHQPQ